MPRSTDFLPSLPKPSISSIKHDWAQAVFRKTSVWHPLNTFFGGKPWLTCQILSLI